MKEIWKSIKQYPNYEVSNLGRVKRIPHKYRKTELILKPQETKNGYLRVNLYKNNRMFHVFIHRLVLGAFQGYNKTKVIVNHRDSNPKNNILTNLEWCTTQENVKYSFEHGNKFMTKGEQCSWHKLTEEQVIDIRNRFKIGAHNMRELADYFNVNKTTIWEIIHRKIWRHI